MKYLLLSCCFLLATAVSAQRRFVAVDSTKIWVNTIGLDDRKEGQPVLVFESGHGTPMDHWDKVLPGVSKLAPVITYDRPGVGPSEAIEEMPSIENVAHRLVRLLEALEVPPPYILVGHSLGGLYVRGFAIHYPELLAGLVIIDPADFTETHQNKRAHYDVLNWEAVRVDSLIQKFIDNRKRRHQEAPPAIRREGQYLETIRENEFEAIQEHQLPNIPVHILVGGRFDKPEQFRSKEYDEEALFRSKMRHRVSRWTAVIQSVDKGMLFYSAGAGHFVHFDQPELLIASLRIVLKDYVAISHKKK
ncbi:MAG: alpha/beta hydrolase [Bacteroidota bacterium]